MRNITLINSAWFKAMPAKKRRFFIKEMFELADEKGWTIRLGGGHYNAS